MTRNQQYKEYRQSGGTLTYKEWRRYTDETEHFNATGDTLSIELDMLARQAGIVKDPQTDLENKYIFGINRNVLIWSGVAVVAGIGIYLYIKHHKK